MIIAVSYLIKRKIKKIFYEVISNTKIFNLKFCSMKLPTTKDLPNLQGTWQRRNCTTSNTVFVLNQIIFYNWSESDWWACIWSYLVESSWLILWRCYIGILMDFREFYLPLAWRKRIPAEVVIFLTFCNYS